MAVFVDVANLYYSARGQDVDVDYVALLKTATKGRDLIRAYAYSGLDPDNENQRKFIDFLGKNGYKVITKDIRKFGDGRVKANLDIELVVDLIRLADRMDIAVIVSGDGDFAPAIRALQDKGVRCEVISFRPNTSSDLIAVTDEFIDIMKIAGIGRNSKEAKAQRGMSAPEMPAKEVTPEFGFREASPGVAKAAMAALREGKPAGGDGAERGRRRTRSTAAAAADEPAETTVPETETTASQAASAETANGDDGPRKRRRRRGGRGRGRGRGRGEQGGEDAATPEEADGEIGWVEVDDLSQLSDLEGIGDLDAEREYNFEEADASTLAELGIDPGEAASTGSDEIAEAAPEEKKPARRRTRATPEGGRPVDRGRRGGQRGEEAGAQPQDPDPNDAFTQDGRCRTERGGSGQPRKGRTRRRSQRPAAAAAPAAAARRMSPVLRRRPRRLPAVLAHERQRPGRARQRTASPRASRRRGSGSGSGPPEARPRAPDAQRARRRPAQVGRPSLLQRPIGVSALPRSRRGPARCPRWWRHLRVGRAEPSRRLPREPCRQRRGP